MPTIETATGPTVGQAIHGHLIVAVFRCVHRPAEAIVVCEARHTSSRGEIVEFITGAVLADDPNPTEWHAGNYFATSANPQPREIADRHGAAYRDALRRAGVEISR